MEEKEIKNWEEFEAELEKLYSERNKLKENRKESVVSGVSELLFRGQANSKWKLKTTLDRYIEEEISLVNYYRLIYVAKPQIETFTDITWDIPDVSEYRDTLRDDPMKPDSYMVYLRHHGYPSPLLDWTNSPYIAAFFAYRKVEKKIKNVSVYVFLEKTGMGKSIPDSKPSITNMYFLGKTHKRHFLQQSQYTICRQTKNKVSFYAKHEDVFSENRQDQDRLLKFILPASQRIPFLEKLNSMNINAFSLFVTEESLMETLALREIEFKSCRLG